MIENIMICPKNTKCGNRDDDVTTWDKKTRGVRKRGSRIAEMFQDVQHQDEVVNLAGLESRIKWRDMDPVAVWALRIDKFGGRLESLDFTELFKG